MRLAILIFLSFVSVFGISQELPKFVHFTTNNGLDQSSVWAIEEDSTHRIWFGSPGGIKVYDGFTLEPVPEISDIVLRLKKHNLSVFAITNGGIYKINPNDFSSQKVVFPKSDYYTSKFSSTGISLYDYEGNLQYFYDYNLLLDTGTVTSVPVNIYSLFQFNLSGFQIHGGVNGVFVNDSIPLSKEYSFRFVKFNENRAFIATHKGLVEILVNHGHVTTRTYFKDWRIEHLLIDHNKNLWVGTADFGVFMVHYNTLQSSFYSKKIDGKPLSCWSLFNIKNETYVATPNGIIPVEKQNWETDQIYQNTKNLGTFCGIDGGDFILIGTRNKGIYRLKNGQLKQVYFNSKYLLDNTIMQFGKNKIGFLVSSKRSLIQLDKNGDYLSKKECSFEKVGSYIMEFYPSEGKIMASQTSGIVELDSNLEILKKYTDNKIQVISMVRPFQNQWWGVSMSAGLFKIEKDSFQTVPFPDHHLFTLTPWSDSILWISSVTSLYEYSQNQVRPYNYQNGLAIKEFNQNARFKNSENFLYYSGVTGVLKFHPDSLKVFPTAPTVIIKRNGKKLDTANTISLQFDQSEIHFQVNPVIISDQNLYKIEIGVDTQWVEISSPKQLNLNVPFGTSNIEVKITDLVHKNSFSTLFPIHRAIPFWQKTWFIILSSIASTLLVIGFVSFVGFVNTRKKLKTERAENRIKEERLRISKELHDNIGARLTHIISSLDVEMYRNKNDTKSIETINAFARDTMSQLRETIWAVSDKAIFFSEFATRIEQYIEQINDLTAMNIQYKQTEFNDFELNPVQTINYYRIVQEAINNSVKYSEADKIEVSIQQKNSKIYIIISDNGTGFDLKNTRFGTGLKGMKTRAEEVNSDLQITSTTQGTSIILTIPI